MVDIDPVQVQMVAEQFERAADNMERLSAATEDLLDKLPLQAEKAAKAVAKGWEKALDPKAIGKLMEEGVDISKTEWEGFFSFMDRSWSGVKKSFQMGVTGVQKLGRASESVGNKLQRLGLANLPFGGILGLMLYGKMREADFRAKGQIAVQQFESVGRVGVNEAKRMGDELRRLEVQLGRDVTGDLAAVAAGFAQSGIGAEVLGEKADFAMRGFGDQLDRVTFGLDRMFEVASGTSAMMSGQMLINTNMGLKESVTLVKDIGLSAGEVGMNFQTMSGSIMQATSALRMQGVDARELADTMATIQRGFEAQGMKKQRAGALAAAGIGGIAGGLAGMDVGMMGFIGERASEGEYTGPRAVQMMRRGFRGGEDEGEFFGKSVAELLAVTSEMANGDELTQEYALQELGMSGEAAQALIALQRQGKDQTEIARLAAKSSDRLATAFRDEAFKVGDFERGIVALRDAIAKMGAALMTIIVNGFQALGLSLAYLIALFRHDGDIPVKEQAFLTQQGLALARSTEKAGQDMADAALQGAFASAGLFTAATGQKGLQRTLKMIFGGETEVDTSARDRRVRENQDETDMFNLMMRSVKIEGEGSTGQKATARRRAAAAMMRALAEGDITGAGRGGFPEIKDEEAVIDHLRNAKLKVKSARKGKLRVVLTLEDTPSPL